MQIARRRLPHCMDRLLDEHRWGPTYQRLPRIASIVAGRIRQGAPGAYQLHAWVVMPNHVHILITPRVDVPLLMRRLKGASAREANQLLGQTGQPFWQVESYDPSAGRVGGIGGGIPVVQWL
jgi:REP element-mobilizing transposase RayT